MRVTQQSLINNFLNNLTQTNKDLLKVSQEISSGKRVERPEDDPIAASAITRINSQLAENSQFSENIQHSLSELNTVDATISEVSSLIMRARELAVQAVNDTLSETERDAIAVEVNQILESMIQIGNSTIGSKALFGGHETLGKPFEIIRGFDEGEVKNVVTIDGDLRVDINANNVTRVIYTGDNQRTATEVDQNLTVGSNITGQELFYFDDQIHTNGPDLVKKEVGVTINTLLENVANGDGKIGISSGFMTFKNTRVPQIRQDTDPDPSVDNSTRLYQLNNRRGVGRDINGNILSLGDVKVTDSAGTTKTFNTNVAPLNTENATIEDALKFLNAEMYDGIDTSKPKLRFFLDDNQIKVQDNAGGSGSLRIEDEVGDGVIGGNLSTFAQDLGIASARQPKNISAAVTPVGLFNDFGGIRFSSVYEKMSGRLEFNDGSFLELSEAGGDSQRFTFQATSGSRKTLFMPFLPESVGIQDVLNALDSQLNLPANSHTFADLNQAQSYVDVKFSNSTSERFTLTTLASNTTSLTGSPIVGISGGANTLNDIMLQVRNRVTNQEINGTFQIILDDGSSYGYNLGRTSLSQQSTMQEVIDELNAQSGLLVGAPSFNLGSSGQTIEIGSPVGTTVEIVVDDFGSTGAFDLGLLKPFLSVNAGFPNLSEGNQNFPGLSFDERTTLGEWLGVSDISSLTNGGQIRIQDSTGRETGIDLQNIEANTTLGEFLEVFNGSGSKVVADFSLDGQGIAYRDKAGGSGNFFVEDFAGSNLVTGLGIGTPSRGSKEFFNGGNMIHFDLRQIGDTITTVGGLLSELNSKAAEIGLSIQVDEATSQLIMKDTRPPAQRGNYAVGAENALGKETRLEELNDGGGINNFKIRVTDSMGVSSIFDFQEAQTIEDVVNSINLSREVITEKTQLRDIEGINFPLGDFEISSSFGTATINLSNLTPASTVLDLTNQLSSDAALVQVGVDLNLDFKDRTLRFSFQDLVGGQEDGRISIRDTTSNTAAEMKLATIASGSPFQSGLLVQRRANITASLSDDRTGLKLVDNFGGELRVTEVEGRTTAFDLGLINQVPGISVSKDSILIGRDLRVYQRLADELGLSSELSHKESETEDLVSDRVAYGAIEDRFSVLKSTSLKTRELFTLQGSVEMDHRLTAKTRLELLNNASDNPSFQGLPLNGVDLSGVLKIESMSDDGTGNFERVIIDLKNLPNNPTWLDLDRLIQAEIAADDQFEASVRMKVLSDGTVRFLSEVPIRIGIDDSFDPLTSPGATIQQQSDAAAARGANSSVDLFGANLTEFSHQITTKYMAIQPAKVGGIELENFFIDDYGGHGSLEVDLNALSYELQETQIDLNLGNVVNFIEINARRPAKIEDGTLLGDLGISFPLENPYGPGDPEFSLFDGLTEASTLGSFLSDFNALPAPSVFNGSVRLEIASSSNSTAPDSGKKLVLLDQTGLSSGATLELRGIPRETHLFFSKLGVQLGGELETIKPGVIGIKGKQITGLGYEPIIEIDSLGKIKIEGVPSYDDLGEEIVGSGRLKIVEGRGETANQLRLLVGTGAVGEGTRVIHSGDMNPSINRQSLLSEINANHEGSASSNFEETLHKLYVENGKDSGFVDLMNPPVTMRTPFKAFNGGQFDSISQFYRGGVDVGRPGSGFVITDQFGNEAIVDLSNNRSESTFSQVSNLTASSMGADATRLTGNPGDFSGFMLGDFVEIAGDGSGLKSSLQKFKITNIDPAGSFIDLATDPTNFDTATANNYSVNYFSSTEDLQAKMERQYTNKPFYSIDSDLTDLQKAIDIAIDKAKRTTGFGVDEITLAEDKESGGFTLLVVGKNGPTISIKERDLDGDGVADSSTAGDLSLLRDKGARGNGTPFLTSGPGKISPSIAYVLDKINKDLSDVNITASIGSGPSGPTLDITSNSDSSYLKVRDSEGGNSAAQFGMSDTRSIFQTLIDFRDSLFRNDSSTISSIVLSNIDEDEERVLQIRAQVGSVVNRFQIGSERLSTNQLELTRRLSDSQDLEITEAIIELRQLENAQRAALSIGSRIIQQSLLDFLR